MSQQTMRWEGVLRWLLNKQDEAKLSQAAYSDQPTHTDRRPGKVVNFVTRQPGTAG